MLQRSPRPANPSRKNWHPQLPGALRKKANIMDLPKARKFVKEIDLSGTPRGMLTQSADAEAGAVFEQAKNQAQVVGSALFSFSKGVDVGIREAISDSALLAQLVANKRVAFDT